VAPDDFLNHDVGMFLRDHLRVEVVLPEIHLRG
jgi:hypothetical protein